MLARMRACLCSAAIGVGAGVGAWELQGGSLWEVVGWLAIGICWLLCEFFKLRDSTKACL